MTRPLTLGEVLHADPAQLREVVEQASHLLARVILLRLAVRRIPEGRELTESRLRRLAAGLEEAVKDGEAALEAWQNNR